MNDAAYFARLIRPDLAMLRESRKRSLCNRLFYWGNRDERLQQMLIRAPMPLSDAEWFAEAALEWVYDYVLPIDHGPVHQPQMAAETMERLSGDCDDGTILLATMLVSALQPEAWPLFRFCVGTVDGMRNHAFLTMERRDLQETVLLDWTLSPKPLIDGEAKWKVDSFTEIG